MSFVGPSLPAADGTSSHSLRDLGRRPALPETLSISIPGLSRDEGIATACERRRGPIAGIFDGEGEAGSGGERSSFGVETASLGGASELVEGDETSQEASGVFSEAILSFLRHRGRVKVVERRKERGKE